jgi:hypothetical protein
MKNEKKGNLFRFNKQLLTVSVNRYRRLEEMMTIEGLSEPEVNIKNYLFLIYFL